MRDASLRTPAPNNQSGGMGTDSTHDRGEASRGSPKDGNLRGVSGSPSSSAYPRDRRSVPGVPSDRYAPPSIAHRMGGRSFSGGRLGSGGGYSGQSYGHSGDFRGMGLRGQEVWEGGRGRSEWDRDRDRPPPPSTSPSPPAPLRDRDRERDLEWEHRRKWDRDRGTDHDWRPPDRGSARSSMSAVDPYSRRALEGKKDGLKPSPALAPAPTPGAGTSVSTSKPTDEEERKRRAEAVAEEARAFAERERRLAEKSDEVCEGVYCFHVS